MEFTKEVMPKDIVIVTTDDNEIKNKMFLVIKKDDENIYAIRLTSKNKSDDQNFCHTRKTKKEKLFYRWNKVYTFKPTEIIEKKGSLLSKIYNEIISVMLKRCSSYEHIDFSLVNYEIKEDSVILMNGEFYLVLKKINEYKYIILKLENGNKSPLKIRVNGTYKEVLTSDGIILDAVSNNYQVVIQNANYLSSLTKDERENLFLKNFNYKDGLEGLNKNKSYN